LVDVLRIYLSLLALHGLACQWAGLDGLSGVCIYPILGCS
jgi:hypothetical protein